MFHKCNKVLCICEFSNGGSGKNGIMCNFNDSFARSFSCSKNSFCTGATSKEKAVDISRALDLLCSGKFYVQWQVYQMKECYLNRHVIWFCCTFVFAFLDAIYCGNEEATYLSCDDCPRTNGTTSDNWCSGNCKFDETYQICKEGNS